MLTQSPAMDVDDSYASLINMIKGEKKLSGEVGKEKKFSKKIAVLSLSIEACDARSLSFGIKDSTVPSHDLSKDVDKGSLGLLKHLKKSTKISELLGGATMPRLEGAKMKREVTMSGAVPILSHVKVSWSPARKNRSKYPGVHVDYVGPRTHPPAHN